MFLTQSNKNMEWSQAYFCAFSYIDALKSAVPCSLPSKSCYSHHMVQHNSPDWLPTTDTVLVLHVSVVSPGMFFHTPMCSCFSGVQLTGEVEQAAQRISAAWTVMIAQTLDSYCSGSQSTTHWHLIRVIDKELTFKSHTRYQAKHLLIPSSGGYYLTVLVRYLLL